MIHSLLDSLMLIDRDIEVAKFVIENGDISLINKSVECTFYSKLLTKLIIGNQPEIAIKLLKFLISKEIGGLDDELVKLVSNSKLNTQNK